MGGSINSDKQTINGVYMLLSFYKTEYECVFITETVTAVPPSILLVPPAAVASRQHHHLQKKKGCFFIQSFTDPRL